MGVKLRSDEGTLSMWCEGDDKRPDLKGDCPGLPDLWTISLHSQRLQAAKTKFCTCPSIFKEALYFWGNR